MTTAPGNEDPYRRLPDGRSLFEAMIGGWVAFVLLLGLASYLQAATMPLPFKIGSLVAIAAAFVACRARSRSQPDWNALGLAVLGASTIATFWWAWRFDSVQQSDFGVYFSCGAQVAANFVESIDTCQSVWMHKNLLYWTRALLYTAPLESVTGASYVALKFYNATLHGATAALWFFGLRHYYGARTATIATLLLAFYPEWFFTTTLATTDNLALLFIVAFILLLPKLEGESQRTLVVLGLGMTLFAANLLRTMGFFLIASLVLWVVIQQCRRWNVGAIARALAVLALYALLSRLLAGWVPPGSSDPLHTLKTFAVVDFHTMQDFASNYPWNEQFWFAIDPDWRARVALEKFVAEFVYGFYRWPLYLYQKAATLFTGTGYYLFASFLYAGVNPDTVFTVPHSTVPLVWAALPWFSSALFAVVALATWGLFRRRPEGPTLAAVVWMGAFALIALGMNEAQPRYTVLIAPALALLAAMALARDETATTHRKTQGSFIAAGFLACAALFAIAAGGLQLAAAKRFNPIVHATALPADATASGCATQPIAARIEASYKRLRIIAPPGSDCTTIALPLSAATRQVTFFVSGSKFPSPWEPRAKSAYRYTLTIGDRVALDAALGTESVRWHHVEVTESAQQVLLTVRRTAATAEDFIDISLFTELP